MPIDDAALDELRALLGEAGVLASDAARFVHEADAMTLERGRPDAIVLPRTTDEIAALVRWASHHGLPVVARGAGTGLAGGCTCEHGGLSLGLARMDRVLRVDAERQFAWVQAGVVNLELSKQVAPLGLTFAPDPASQQVSTIGGNVATNAGGPHCLKYGVTFNHVLGLTVVLADGAVVTLGGEGCDAPDFDLAAVVIGSEGTTAIVAEICVRLVPASEAVQTMLFDFASLEDACNAVSSVIAAGIVPAALELMDRVTVRMVDAWLQLGLPVDAAAVLLIEVDGPASALPAQAERIVAIARAHRAGSVRVAADDAERAQLWRARKSAFGAYGRAHDAFFALDAVVPRTRLADALSSAHDIAAAHGLRAGSLAHAGDGNLHPHVMFDPALPHEREAARIVEREILRMCIARGGTITGEHGVGIEKRPLMAELYAPVDLAIMERLRGAFDPARHLNPGKVLPAPGEGAPQGAAARVTAEEPWR